MGFLKKAAACAGVLAAASAGETAYFYRRTMMRNNMSEERTIKMSGTDWGQYRELMETRKAYMLEQTHEEICRKSFDGLKLHATYFPACSVGSACCEVQNTKKLAICFHGYASKGISDFMGLSDYYLKRGFAMLLPDARAHGESEGKYVGFGCLDRRDALMWINWAISELGEDVEIVLHGISMGGATVLMASGLELPPQVKGIISDCGFTSPKEVFTHVLNTMYHLPAFPVIPCADALNKKLAGYGMDECNAKREVEKANIPILFIHGSKDTFVPSRMCNEIYEHCASDKRILIVEGATHAESYYKDMAAYEQAMTDFFGDVL